MLTAINAPGAQPAPSPPSPPPAPSQPAPPPDPPHADRVTLKNVAAMAGVSAVSGIVAAAPAAATAAFGIGGFLVGVAGVTALLTYTWGKSTEHTAMPIGGIAGLAVGIVGGSLSGAAGAIFGWPGVATLFGVTAVGTALLARKALAHHQG